MPIQQATNGYYYGCWEGFRGHFLHKPGGFRVAAEEVGIPWASDELGGRLCPRTPTQYQPEGIVQLHWRDGWTALAFWDRTVDQRHGSSSVFVLLGTLAFDEAVRVAGGMFPEVFGRFPFLLELVKPRG